MPSYNPSSTKGVALEKATLDLIAKGAVELAPLPSFGFYSRLFLVWKTSGSWRPVIDLSTLNCFVDMSHFQMETIQSVLLSVHQGDWMASIRSSGGLPAGSCPSGIASLPLLCDQWPGVSVQGVVFRPLHGPAGFHSGHGSCFCHPPLAGYPRASLPRRLAHPVFFSGVSLPRSPGSPGSLSGTGYCGQLVRPFLRLRTSFAGCGLRGASVCLPSRATALCCLRPSGSTSRPCPPILSSGTTFGLSDFRLRSASCVLLLGICLWFSGSSTLRRSSLYLGLLFVLCRRRRCFCWPSLRPNMLGSCRLSPVLLPLWDPMPVSYVPQFVAKSESLTRSIPRSFLVKSLSDFAAGLDEDLLLCPVSALCIYLDRTRSLAPVRHRLFVSPRRPSRAMSKNAVSFFLREVIHAARASRPEVGSVRAHEIRGVSTSVAFHRNWSVSAVLESATWSSSSVFSSFYLRDIQHEYDGIRSLGPFVAAGSRIE